MVGSEMAVQWPIWIALTAGVLAIGGRWSTAAWRFGAISFLVHVGAAFEWVHGWSHAQALAATAQQTRAVTGWNSGGGLWVNYAFAATWVWVALFWPRLPLTARRIWVGWFLFMELNGAVIFVSGAKRWFGLALFVAACWRCWRWSRRPEFPTTESSSETLSTRDGRLRGDPLF